MKQHEMIKRGKWHKQTDNEMQHFIVIIREFKSLVLRQTRKSLFKRLSGFFCLKLPRSLPCSLSRLYVVSSTLATLLKAFSLACCTT